MRVCSWKPHKAFKRLPSSVDGRILKLLNANTFQSFSVFTLWLGAVSWQSITWTNVDQNLRHIYVRYRASHCSPQHRLWLSMILSVCRIKATEKISHISIYVGFDILYRKSVIKNGFGSYFTGIRLVVASLNFVSNSSTSYSRSWITVVNSLSSNAPSHKWPSSHYSDAIMSALGIVSLLRKWAHFWQFN